MISSVFHISAESLRFTCKLFLIAFFILFSFGALAQEIPEVHIVGKMSDVMWKGDLKGKIMIDTLQQGEKLYGLGPLENLTGEILIWKGRPYVSSINSTGKMLVETKKSVKAPFFAYAYCDEWNQLQLPDTILTMNDLEIFLEKITTGFNAPFLFRISAKVDSASLHVVNLPHDSKVRSPDDAHKGRVSFLIQNEEVLALGFFSTRHKTIFTHHDTFLHLHLMNSDQSKMGHLDTCRFKKGSITLFLPRIQ